MCIFLRLFTIKLVVDPEEGDYSNLNQGKKTDFYENIKKYVKKTHSMNVIFIINIKHNCKQNSKK